MVKEYSFEELILAFKKKKRQALLTFLIFLIMLVIWIVCFVLRYEGKSIFILLTFQFLVLILFMGLFVIDWKKVIYSEKLLENNKKFISSELNKKVVISSQDNYLYTESFYVDFENLNVVKYDEIILFYKKTITREPSYKFGTKQYIILITKTGEKIEIINKSLKTYDLIKERCKMALIGYTKDNIEEIKKIYKINV